MQGPVCARPMCARRPLLRVLLLAASLSIVAGATARPTLRTGTTNGATNGNIRRAVLCTLAVQNACQMLSMRYSRMPGQPKYLTSTAVVTAEATKIVAAFIVMLYNSRGRAFAEVWQGVFVDWRDTILVGVPAFLYLIQNNLLYVATTHLDAATCQAPPVCPTTCRRGRAPWRVEQACSCSTLGARPGPQSTALPEQVAYQLKLLTTAFFSVTMLKRHISLRRCRRPPTARPRAPPSARVLLGRGPRSARRWLALGILFVGVVLVQSPKVAEEAAGSNSAVLGMAAVVSACLLSGLAGVWLERIVKRTNEARQPTPLAPPARGRAPASARRARAG